MKRQPAQTALLTLAAGILTGGALALTATSAAAAQDTVGSTPGLVAMTGDADGVVPVGGFLPSNPSGA